MRASQLLTSRDRADLADRFLPVLATMGCGDDILSWAAGYVVKHAGRVQADVDYLAGQPRFGSCLNIGGAPFLFEYLLRQRLPEVAVTSLDLEPDRFPQVRSVLGIDILPVNVEVSADVAGIGRRYDRIVFCEIFEHLRLDLLATLASIRSLLSERGELYLTTPNGVSLAGIKRVLRGDTGPDPLGEWTKLKALGHMGHVREYSTREVVSLLAGAGFRVTACRFRQPQDGTWTARAARLKTSLAAEIVIVARAA